MNSAMRSRHLKRLRATYGYGNFKRSVGDRNVGIEQMSLIRGYKEVVVTSRASPTIPETTTMVRAVAAVTSASSSPGAEGLVTWRGWFLPPGTVDQIGSRWAPARERLPAG